MVEKSIQEQLDETMLELKKGNAPGAGLPPMGMESAPPMGADPAMQEEMVEPPQEEMMEQEAGGDEVAMLIKELTEVLGLTPEQVAKLEMMMEEMGGNEAPPMAQEPPMEPQAGGSPLDEQMMKANEETAESVLPEDTVEKIKAAVKDSHKPETMAIRAVNEGVKNKLIKSVEEQLEDVLAQLKKGVGQQQFVPAVNRYVNNNPGLAPGIQAANADLGNIRSGVSPRPTIPMGEKPMFPPATSVNKDTVHDDYYGEPTPESIDAKVNAEQKKIDPAGVPMVKSIEEQLQSVLDELKKGAMGDMGIGQGYNSNVPAMDGVQGQPMQGGMNAGQMLGAQQQTNQPMLTPDPKDIETAQKVIQQAYKAGGKDTVKALKQLMSPKQGAGAQMPQVGAPQMGAQVPPVGAGAGAPPQDELGLGPESGAIDPESGGND